MARTLLAPHQGLGDLFLTAGMISYLNEKTENLSVIVTKRYLATMRQLFPSESGVRFFVLPNIPRRLPWSHFELLAIFLFCLMAQLLGFRVIRLGYLGKNFLGAHGSFRFDENFYKQADLDFGIRWSHFPKIGSTEKSKQVAETLGCNQGDYVFLHEDSSRGFTIDRKLLPAELPVIEPILDPGTFTPVDYFDAIVGASEVHCIESSFVALIESLEEIPPELFAHRYSRPEASKDWKHEFSYRKAWKVHLTN